MIDPRNIRPEQAMREEIVELEHAYIVPPEAGGRNAPAQKSRVFDADRKFVEASILMRPNGFFNSEPPFPAEDAIVKLSGSHMYGGVLFGHFGHFLMDSLARVWATERLADRIESILFTPKTNAGNLANMLKVQTPLFRALGVENRIQLIVEPTEVERLFVPRQGIGIAGWDNGMPAFRDYMRRKGGKHIEPSGGDRIYVSRSALPKGRASILGEKRLEEYLQSCGFEIMYPEKLGKEEQIARYRAARFIVSPDGSPLHLLAYVGHSDQSVAIIARRSASTHNVFEAQLKAFTGARAVTINCLLGDWLPEGATRAGRTSWGELDFAMLHGLLRDNGFIPADEAPWSPPSEEELAAELATIETAEGVKFRKSER